MIRQKPRPARRPDAAWAAPRWVEEKTGRSKARQKAKARCQTFSVRKTGPQPSCLGPQSRSAYAKRSSTRRPSPCDPPHAGTPQRSKIAQAMLCCLLRRRSADLPKNPRRRHGPKARHPTPTAGTTAPSGPLHRPTTLLRRIVAPGRESQGSRRRADAGGVFASWEHITEAMGFLKAREILLACVRKVNTLAGFFPAGGNHEPWAGRQQPNMG